MRRAPLPPASAWSGGSRRARTSPARRPGMEWVLEAAEDVTLPPRWPQQVSTEASWVVAALWCGNALFEARLRGILNMVDKQRDSVKMTVTKALTAWLRTSIR